MRYENTTVGVARPDAPLKVVKRLPKALIAQMRHVEDDAESFHFLKQLASGLAEAAGGIRSLGINSRAIMCRPDGAKPLCVGTLKIL